MQARQLLLLVCRVLPAGLRWPQLFQGERTFQVSTPVAPRRVSCARKYASSMLQDTLVAAKQGVVLFSAPRRIGARTAASSHRIKRMPQGWKRIKGANDTQWRRQQSYTAAEATFVHSSGSNAHIQQRRQRSYTAAAATLIHSSGGNAHTQRRQQRSYTAAAEATLVHGSGGDAYCFSCTRRATSASSACACCSLSFAAPSATCGQSV